MKTRNFVLLFASFWVSNCFAVQPISPTAAYDLVKKDKALLIDVREAGELKETGIAEPAIFLPKSEVDGKSEIYQGFVKNADRKIPVIFYCRSGKRADVVAKHFDSLQFTTYNMGTLQAWIEAGLPVVPFEKRR